MTVPDEGYFRNVSYTLNLISTFLFQCIKGAVLVVIVWQLDLQIPVQSMPFTTKAVSWNPVHGKVYSIQHYVIQFVSDLWFSLGTPVSPQIKLATTIYLKYF
jgi:hypothetical protein